ncbi:MAG: hypothetical protein J6J01_10520 [Oscillospiraceae bacterium]|nr:hypothetical protein [Oscillospiraceae bacterium]MBP3699894.1 hypothetical protein [Oscillospiraceae bacterium]
MIIKVLGKVHREGVSKKNGRPFNFNKIHYLGKARGVEGQAALTATLDGFDYPYERIMVGHEYNIEFDMTGFVMEFAPVK